MPRGFPNGQRPTLSPEKKAALQAGAARWRASRPFEVRFWEKVDKRGPDECWPWKAHLTQFGYGELFWTEGGKNLHAHRASWIIHGNELPKWPLVLDHVCRNRWCTNPAHLRVVTQRINTIENSESQWARNHAKTHCKRGHEFTRENTAIVTRVKRGKTLYARQCLTCFPWYWRQAVVPRARPAGSRIKRGDPDYKQLREGS